jgi:hypothetical protein
MANYPYRIPSVANRNQGLPAVLFDVVNLDRVIEADNPINLVDLKRAEAVVEGLKGAQGLLNSYFLDTTDHTIIMLFRASPWSDSNSNSECSKPC